jgi:hypothetical protein
LGDGAGCCAIENGHADLHRLDIDVVDPELGGWRRQCGDILLL